MTENIHIAILGPISAGKSTLLNGLFCDTFSDMKRKRTTMLPQIYQITNDNKKYMSSAEISTLNTKINNEILQKRDANTFTPNDFKEHIYIM